MPLKPWWNQSRAATRALEQSREDLAVAEKRAEEAASLATIFRKIRRENHLGPDLRRALEGA